MSANEPGLYHLHLNGCNPVLWGVTGDEPDRVDGGMCFLLFGMPQCCIMGGLG